MHNVIDITTYSRLLFACQNGKQKNTAKIPHPYGFQLDSKHDLHFLGCKLCTENKALVGTCSLLMLKDEIDTKQESLT